MLTRFAPSPTGDVHLGNARTALFNWLMARHASGRFIVRIEDTDAERSREALTAALIADLKWLGLDWDAGPDHEDQLGPYRQSQRGEHYKRYFQQLEKRGATYPCYCTALELDLSRRSQLAAGKPPRYAGTCRSLTHDQRQRREGQGQRPTLRFRVPDNERIHFSDFVHGEQSFVSSDIGDFVIRRADGTAAFFFCNAVDDAEMGVTHVLRGEDHLTNTPRQLLLLDTLGLARPIYGHVSLIVGNDGSPLSKRHGATSVADYRAQGYTPEALVNHLFRLGHATTDNRFLTLDEMATIFDMHHLGRSPSRFDEDQLRVWQKDSVHRMSREQTTRWLAQALPAGHDEATLNAFVEAVAPNLVLPADAKSWADVVFGDPPALDAAETELVREAGAGYFAAATEALNTPNSAPEQLLPTLIAALKAATGRKGAALYMPLRLALTGRAHGPELAPLLKAIPREKARARLARFAS